MAKFIVTLVVETDEPKGERPPTKKALRATFREDRAAWPRWDGGYTQLKQVRVRSIDID